MHSARCFCHILMELEFSQIFEKYWNMELHENPCRWSRVVPCGRPHMTQLIVACRNFANAPNILSLYEPPLLTVAHQVLRMVSRRFLDWFGGWGSGRGSDQLRHQQLRTTSSVFSCVRSLVDPYVQQFQK
jgi:hypothetical protein